MCVFVSSTDKGIEYVSEMYNYVLCRICKLWFTVSLLGHFSWQIITQDNFWDEQFRVLLK
jgi:hypothetical protein